jgi:hypothetical protein
MALTCKSLYICIYFTTISNCLFLKINHMMELQKCAFIFEPGVVTNTYCRPSLGLIFRDPGDTARALIMKIHYWRHRLDPNYYM